MGETNRVVRRLRSVAAAALTLAVVACGDDPTGVPDELDSGMLATFRVQSDTFRVWTTRAETMQQLEALEAGESDASIPNGVLRRGAGRGEFNAPWSWHMDPEAVTMAESTFEVCDGRPSFVESSLDTWIEDIGRYCPWSAELVRLQDLR